MADKIAGETIESSPTSREGKVYITAKHVYKSFGRRTNPYDVLETYKTAEAAGVPLPDTCKITAELSLGGETSTFSGIRMTRRSGTFFQISKGGGERTLINAIMSITNREMLNVALRGLQAASQLGVMDPQGFISSTANPPLCFIDLHFRGSPNTASFERAIMAARVTLERLG